MRVVLVLADDRAVRESIRASWPEGDLLLFESRLDAAARRLVSLQTDALIVDDSPGLGVEAVESLKALAPGAPILALSNRGDDAAEAALLRAGAEVFVPKPFSCDVLVAEVERITARPYCAQPPMPGPACPPAVADRSVNQHQMALRWLSRASLQGQDREGLARTLIETTVDVFDATRSAVVLEAEGLLRIVASQGITENISKALRLSFSTGLMRWLDEHGSLFDRRQAELDPHAANQPIASAIKEMRLLNAWLAAPLMQSGQVFGAVLLGEKASGTPYSAEERELLILLARCISGVLERARVYADTVREQGKLDNILAHINAGVIAVSASKTISMMNQSAERILKVRSCELLGKSVQKLGSAFADVALRTLADGKPRLRQEIRDPAVGATLGLSATSLGRDGVVIVFSELQADALNPQEVADSPIWGYLASRVAQEVKNPMVAINTFAQLLPKKYDSADFREAFGEVVQREVARINAVVETLFTFAETPRLRLEPVNFVKVLQGILEGLKSELAEHAVRLEAELAAEDAETELDTRQFETAFRNIVRNSIEAMPEGGVLRVRARRENGFVEARVSDSGPGIPAEDGGVVFAPFFGTREHGMGLGLTIAGKIIKGHKGELNVVRTEDGGTALAFRLPVVRAGHADHSGH